MPDRSVETVAASRAGPSRRRPALRLWHIPLALLVLAVACVLLLRWRWQHEFRQRIEAIAAQGYPVTPAELDAWYKWPESGGNAADYILDAASCYIELPSSESSQLGCLLGPRRGRLPSTEPLPDAAKRILTAHVQANARAIELALQAGKVEVSRWPIDLSDGFETITPDLAWPRKLGYLLCHQAILRAEEQDTAGATEALEAAFGVTRSLRAEPVFISQLIRFAVNARMLRAVERVLCRSRPNGAELRRLQRAVHAADDPDALVRALVGARCMNLELFQRPESIERELLETSDGLPPPVALEMYKDVGLAAREGVLFLDLMTECIDAVQSSAPGRYEAGRLLQAQLPPTRKGYVLLPRLSNIGHLVLLEADASACLRTALAALGVQRYWLAHGELPSDLADFVPDFLDSVPDDPFDGRPLRYKRLDDGFCVYSVGRDRSDDGGKEQPVSGGSKPGDTHDLVFTVRPRHLPPAAENRPQSGPKEGLGGEIPGKVSNLCDDGTSYCI
ncbi:MAG: hypothetical protein JW993_17110 [Sedimentisphaerales bacterium]|nr:hypothetical protein [Sedimentisphaerales bacterium]